MTAGNWLRIEVLSELTPTFLSAGESLRRKRTSTSARARVSSSASFSTSSPVAVSLVPPPLLPPTTFSTRGAPARLFSVSMACQAAL